MKKHINMEIKVGDYNVLESGSVVCMDGYPIVFTFGKLTYKVIIHRDKGADELGKNVVFLMNAKDMNIGEIQLYLEDSVALASSTPYKVGNYNGKSLSFAFHIEHFTAMSDPKMPIALNYTWLQRDTTVIFEPTESGKVKIEEK